MVKCYIDENNETLFVCPNCGLQKQFNASRFKLKKNIKITCKCGHTENIQIEFRKFFRKKTELPGVCTIDKNRRKCDILIKDISIGGVAIQFVFINKKYLADIKEGDIVHVEFKIDNSEEKVITKKCVVRQKIDDIVGAEFADENYAKIIGSYIRG